MREYLANKEVTTAELISVL